MYSLAAPSIYGVIVTQTQVFMVMRTKVNRKTPHPRLVNVSLSSPFMIFWVTQSLGTRGVGLRTSLSLRFDIILTFTAKRNLLTSQSNPNKLPPNCLLILDHSRLVP